MSAGTTFDVFLSYHWRDHARVEGVARCLRDEGLRVFLDRWYLVGGRPRPEALEQAHGSCRAVAVFVGPGEMGPWQQREKYLALERQGRDPPGPDVKETLDATFATLSPYRGLQYFREEGAPFFFGRESATERLVAAVARPSLIGVVGAPGSGKSSVVRAGLLPWLRRGQGRV
jgi:hypothetical protein